MKEDVNELTHALPILNTDHELHLKELFHVYSNLSTASGSRGNLNAGGTASLQDLNIDATRFVKFFKDQQLLNKYLTVTDLDIVFNRVKGPGKKDRKLDYNGFNRALYILSMIRFHPDPNAPPEQVVSQDKMYQDLILQIYNNKGTQPIFKGTVPETSGVFSKLTDGSKSGLETDTPKKRNSQGTLQHTSSTGNIYKVGSKSSINAKTASHSSLLNPNKGATQLGSTDYTPTVPVIPKGSVFDRLTNTKGYTGTHKERFNDDGTGRGIDGRRQEDVGPVSLDKLVSRV